jgi:chitinase
MIVAPYYAGWEQSALPPSAIPWDKLSHIIHFSLLPTASGGLSESNGINSGNSSALISAAHSKGKKALIAIGGTPGSENFASAVNSTNRPAFVRNIANLVTSRGYDGVDLDWEGSVNNNDYLALMRDLRAALPGKLLSGVYFGSWTALAGASHSLLDWVAMMSYLPYGQPANSHNAAIYGPLYARIDNLVTLWRNAGVPANKIVIGLALYASVWSNGNLSSSEAELPFRSAKAKGYATNQKWDATAKTSYWDSGSTFVSIENGQSVVEKAVYAKAKGLGGIIVWELGAGRDGTSVPLMSSIGPNFLGTSTTTPTEPTDPITPTDPVTPTATLAVGDTVKVTAGTYKGMTGKITYISGTRANVKFTANTRSILLSYLQKV